MSHPIQVHRVTAELLRYLSKRTLAWVVLCGLEDWYPRLQSHEGLAFLLGEVVRGGARNKRNEEDDSENGEEGTQQGRGKDCGHCSSDEPAVALLPLDVHEEPKGEHDDGQHGEHSQSSEAPHAAVERALVPAVAATAAPGAHAGLLPRGLT
eukprot:CAMPEP_0114615252 /NCGR_PEP_ID=MMETSP0168-20121206/6069_1 /TAXON_ID=95228 ORGANISM="Vannella sp., Strain DIVA3 517/6/12" /NCGR_SAMPLE_ID=MMETSP0168 /ASSEMBLY_ACC=CAM_ASM_000044 /LENGTH=151 /DNA_ID=CAMNT_0001826317 /DNA_START=381 /DNA_END=837 /DNA_ORIENTATION=-